MRAIFQNRVRRLPTRRKPGGVERGVVVRRLGVGPYACTASRKRVTSTKRSSLRTNAVRRRRRRGALGSTSTPNRRTAQAIACAAKASSRFLVRGGRSFFMRGSVRRPESGRIDSGVCLGFHGILGEKAGIEPVSIPGPRPVALANGELPRSLAEDVEGRDGGEI